MAASSDQVARAFTGRVGKDEQAALNDDAVLNACVGLCTRFSMSADDLVNEWEVSAQTGGAVTSILCKHQEFGRSSWHPQYCLLCSDRC